ncbi:MAG: hypothetical protein IT375_23370 [Polyangiaceae bacterium]|nr:hypothetical protein [Polyangiaceae bacterium]MCK6534445.1 hypothetical protein [Polyangiaceae bacterium]
MRARMLLLASALGGCAATQSVTADTTDYDLYRRTRTATSSEARLRASFDYLERAPDGRWRPEVKAWFDRAEPLYWERMQTSVGGLRAYLATLPRGPHGKLAAERVLEQRAGARMDQARDRELLDDALSVEQRLADADQMRKTVVRELGEWTARLATIPSFGKPTSELPHETIHHYRVLEPVARCADERCKKTLALPYAIPDGKRLSARKALLDVELGLYRGNVVRARLAGPELWSRLYECSDRTPVRADDAQARTEAIARAVQIVESALGPRFAEASCQREAVSPWVLERECRGVRIRMQAALTPETDDEITVEPVQQP